MDTAQARPEAGKVVESARSPGRRIRIGSTVGTSAGVVVGTIVVGDAV